MTDSRRHVWMRTLPGIACLTAAVVAGLCAHANEPDRNETTEETIVPIQFADLMEDESTTIEPLMIPSVVVEEEIVPGEVVSDEGTIIRSSEQPLDEVSARAADGLRIQEFGVDEMPYESSSGGWFSSGRWYGSAEVLFFDRSRNYRRVLAHDVTFTPGRKNLVGSLTTTGIPFDLSPGARVTLGEYLGRDYLDRDQSLEVTYYGGLAFSQQDDWNALPDSYLVTPLADINVFGFNGAQTYATSHHSNFNSLELNYKLHRRLGRDQLVMSPSGNWTKHAERGWLPALIIGTRVATVNEAFMLSSRRNDVPRSQFGGDYNINTQNWLWGFNLGGELISQNEFYYWGLRGRATPAMSFAANQQTVNGTNQLTIPPPPATPFPQGTVDRRSAASQFGPGFVGDLSLFAGWNVTPNFSLKAGYDFLWVAGVATATRQFNLDNIRQNPIDGGGQIFYNGLSLGCEGSW